MAQIGKLTQFQKGQAPQASLLNTNFETLRLANNDIVNRLLALVDNPDFILPEKYDVIISEIAEIASLNLFGTVDEVTYDNNKLSATRYNENLEAFRAAILLRGLNVKNHEVSTLGYDDSILLGTETAQSSLPTAPSNLEITGVLIDDGTYGVSGDRIIGLEWTDNSDNETGFEIYQSTVDMNNVDYFTMKFSPDDGAILMLSPASDVTSSIINIGQDFLYPLPEDMVVPDPETPPESLTIFNKLPLDNNELRGHNINYWMRASSLVGYSQWSNKVFTGKWLQTPTPFEPRPYDVSLEYSGENLEISFNMANSNVVNPRLGFEVYISYASSSSSGEDFTTFPYKLVYKNTTPQQGACSLIVPYNKPAAIWDGSTQKNKYMLIKVVSFNALQRSLVSVSDTTDVARILNLPNTPSNLQGSFVDNTGVGGDCFVNLSWTRNSDANTEVYGKWGGGAYQLLATVTGNTYNHNTGTHPTGIYTYKVRAVNSEGNSEYTSEINIDTLIPYAPSSLTATLNDSNEDDYIINLAWTNNDSYTNIEVWYQEDSASYSLLDTIAGSLTSYAHHIGEAPTDSDHTYYYKIRGIK